MKIKYIDIIVFFISAIYFSSCLMLMTENETPKFLFFISKLLLFVFSVILISKYNQKILWIYLPIFLFYLFYGFLNGNRWGFIRADIFNALVLISIFLYNKFNKDMLSTKIINMLSIIIFIGGISAFYYLVDNGFQAAQSLQDRIIVDESKDEVSLKSAFAVLQLSIILLPFIWHVDFKRKACILFTFGIYTVASFMMLSRANLAGAGLSLILTSYIGYRKGEIGLNYKTTGIIMIGIMSSLFLANKYGEDINLLTEFVALRFQGIEGTGFSGAEVEVEEPRDIEAREYFSRIQPHEFIIGKGMGAANHFPFGRYHERGLMMMHRGENNLIMKGGIIYLILIYGSALIALIKLLRSNSLYNYSWASVILIYMLLERGHNQYSQFFMLFFLCLAISYAFSLTSKRKVRVLSG